MSAMATNFPIRAVMRVALLGALPAAALPALAAAPHVVCLQPLGRHEARLLAPIARGIGQAYGFQVRTLPERALPKSAWYAPRGRYRAAMLLDFLGAEARAEQPACKLLLGVTAVDISASKGAHADWGVLGLSYTGAGVSVVSTFRMLAASTTRR
jgi:archaemetzincin